MDLKILEEILKAYASAAIGIFGHFEAICFVSRDLIADSFLTYRLFAQEWNPIGERRFVTPGVNGQVDEERKEECGGTHAQTRSWDHISQWNGKLRIEGRYLWKKDSSGIYEEEQVDGSPLSLSIQTGFLISHHSYPSSTFQRHSSTPAALNCDELEYGLVWINPRNRRFYCVLA